MGIQSNIIGEPIAINHLLKDDYAAVFLIKATNNMKIAIFTIYSPPLIPMNKDLLNFKDSYFKFFIIMGELNAKNKSYFCKKENPKGIWLERFTTGHQMHLVNKNKPTYLRSKKVIDLTICSNAIFMHFSKFSVLNNKISDHQPTISIFSKIEIEKMDRRPSSFGFDHS